MNTIWASKKKQKRNKGRRKKKHEKGRRRMMRINRTDETGGEGESGKV
jgi:hypothetical protein